jgi:hypothetical protein
MAGAVKSAAQPAAHSSRATPALDPHPTIKTEALPVAPEPRQSERAARRSNRAGQRASQFNGLVDGSERLVARQGGYHPRDLPPVAEALDVSVIPASVGTRCSLECRIIPVAFDEIGSIGKSDTTMDEWSVHPSAIARPPFRDCRQVSSTMH